MMETRYRDEPAHDTQIAADVAKRARWGLGILLVVLAGAAWFLSPALRGEVSELVEMMARGRVDALGDRLESYGLWGPLISLGIMVLQGVLAPIPAFVVTFANGLAFGAFTGWLISLAGHALASSVSFALARRLGRRRVESLITKRGLGAADRWLDRWGPQAVFVSRLLPGISFDGISYAAGLTSISFKRFLIATTLGVIPETLLFSYLGQAAHEHAPVVMGIAFAVTLIGLAVAAWQSRNARKSE